MATVEPVPGAPAATADLPSERALLLADYHAGIEAGLRYERGVELASNAAERRARVLDLLDRTDADRLVVLGDLGHRIGRAEGAEADELETLVNAVTARAEMTLVVGNHDSGIADEYADRMQITPPEGIRIGDVGLVHGHTWPAPEVLAAETVCMGHEHPAVRLEDPVGGSRVERAWLRGPLRRDVFTEGLDRDPGELSWGNPELVVFPAFNDRSGGTWINVEGQEFLAPFLPDGLTHGDAYLLDGTRLGDYRRV